MSSVGIEAEMEQCTEDPFGKGELVSSCVTPQLADGNSINGRSHHQEVVKRDSPDSPSPVKRWEIGPLLQSFKSKMASFTEIVMSPVRLFKPADSLSSIVLPDECDKFITESNMESSTSNMEEELSDSKCKNRLSKRPSSEKVQPNSTPKRHRVVQRLNFGTFSGSNQEPVLEHNEVYDKAQVTSKDNQTDCLSLQSKAIQNENCDGYPSIAKNPSSDKPLDSTKNKGGKHASVVIHRLSGTWSSEMDCKHDGTESNAVPPDSTDKSFLNNPKISSTTDDNFNDEDVRRDYNEESCLQPTRKSPRKLFKHLLETTGCTSTKLATFGTVPKTSVDEMEEVHTCHSKASDPAMSTSVGNVRSKRCREAPTTKKDMASQKCAKNKVNKRSVILEENQEDIICVQIRKKRKAFCAAQKRQDTNNGLSTSNTAELYHAEPADIQKKHTRKNSNSTVDAPKSILTDKSPHSKIIYECSCEISRMPELKDKQKHEGEKTKMQKRRRVLESSADSSSQKRSCHLSKHKFKDNRVTSVVDLAGPSEPSKKTQLHKTVIADEEQVMTPLPLTLPCGPELRKNKKALNIPLVQYDSTIPLQSDRERKLSKPTKSANRRKGKQPVSVAKRKNVNRGKEKAVIQEKNAVPVLSLSGSGTNRLLRSYSCPEIPSLLFSDPHVEPSHTHETNFTSPAKKISPVRPSVHLHSPSKRLRRHTVCSVEIEREIAPLCLRKEVYPASRGSPSHPLCPSSPYSPSNSLTALASCFLSSPLAFLSKNSSLERSHASDISNSRCHSDASSFTSNIVTSLSPSLCSSPFASPLKPSSPLAGPSTVITPSPEIPSASVSSLCSALSQSSSVGEYGTLHMECQENMDEEKRKEQPNFCLQFSAAILEEKALSDSEIKGDSKVGQRGKVSSIRICKKIPKPQNNLTPMGLPKIIRIKKKDFSLEEIYTNKNFSKPPDRRLETIFEVPLNRRDGSQAVVGQKKVKRFIEFPELGVARKPKKPLVVGITGGGAQRKPGGNSVISRTRRGVGASSKVEDGLTLQQLDSLLCSKLEELDIWMALQQVAS